MKKIALLIIAFASSANAQHILRSSILFDNEVHPNIYIFIPSAAKTLEKDWKTYLSKTGKVSEDKDQITVNVKSSDISRDLTRIISFILDYKSFSAVQVILLDENGRSLAADQINTSALERMFYNFYDLAYFNQEVIMAETDLSFAEKIFNEAEKAKSRVERNLASNLKAQEKLGKKLDETPEKLSEIIQEKDAVYQKLLQNENAEAPVDENFEKEFSKTEFKLLKTKSISERKAKKLKKKKEEFIKISDELFVARQDLIKSTLVLESKKVVLQDLTKK